MPPHAHRHLSIRIRPVRRHEGDSFARQVAYIGRTTQLDPRTGVRYDYSGGEETEATGIVGWVGDIDSLVAAAAFAEPRRRSKAVEGRIVILALPVEFTKAERRQATWRCARYFAAVFGVAVAAAIHRPPEGGDRRNWHAHLLFTSRIVQAGAALGAKTRALDTLKTGPQLIEKFRAWWCAELNSLLQEAGHAVTIEHKSFARLGIQRQPSRHEGETRTAISRRRELKKSATIRPLSPAGVEPQVGLGRRPNPGMREVEESAGNVVMFQSIQLAHAPLFARPAPVAPRINLPGLEPSGKDR